MQKMENIEKKQRIWELDAARGLMILGVIAAHFIYDLTKFTDLGIGSLPIYELLIDHGGLLFVILSGICVTLGTNSTERGLTVLAFGLGISVVTYFLGLIWPSFSSLTIIFGILHLLGFCMVVYPLFKRLNVFLVLGIGVVLIFLGNWVKTLPPSDSLINFILGFRSEKHSSGDYFPILVNLGWFLVGSFIGRTVYRKKRSLLPNVKADNFLLKFLRLCGRNSLWIYLAHQPVIFVVMMIFF